jgi:uncharacterized C2H2 Zn-finger protein
MFQSLNEIKWEQALKALQNTPVEDNIKGKDLKNSIILYYKFGCPDCDAVFALEKNYFKNNKVYWVSTRSKQGKKLLEKYSVQEVPSGVYIDSNGAGTALILYYSENGESKFDTNNADVLSQLQQYDKNHPADPNKTTPNNITSTDGN